MRAMTPLEGFVREHLGPVVVLRAPAVISSARVLHVRDREGREWFAKRLVAARPWHAESTAYDVWGHLPQVPSVHARCERRRALLVEKLPGREPSGQSRRVLRAAGALLRELHGTPPPATWTASWRDLVAADVERRLRHLAAVGLAVDARLVRHHSERLVGLDLPEVATHGDFQPHNWRWRRPGRLAAFDFGAAGLRPAAWDFGRLRYAACWDRPRVFAALVAGYGRPLEPREQAFVEAMLPWRAVVAMSLGARHDRPEMVEHGQLVLGSFAQRGPG